jgi:rhamnosyltransferase
VKPQKELTEYITKLSKIEYIWNGNNLGLAKALNIGAAKATECGYDYLLTMDQDSRATPDMVLKLTQCLNNYDRAKVGIVAPFHITKASGSPEDVDCHEVLTVMTSGNLVNLTIYNSVGPFREDFFIDYIDEEYCLRLRQKGSWSFEQTRHCLNIILVKYDIIIYEQNIYHFQSLPFRRYFMTRNRFVSQKI